MPRFLPLLLLVASACSSSPTAPSRTQVPLNQSFMLRIGETAVVSGTTLSVRFERVEDDSRCPADALCVWQGDALVAIRAGRTDEAIAAWRLLQLHTGLEPKEGDFQEYRIRLEQLAPYPFSSRPIAPSDYQAVLLVTRRSAPEF